MNNSKFKRKFEEVGSPIFLKDALNGLPKFSLDGVSPGGLPKFTANCKTMALNSLAKHYGVDPNYLTLQYLCENTEWRERGAIHGFGPTTCQAVKKVVDAYVEHKNIPMPAIPESIPEILSAGLIEQFRSEVNSVLKNGDLHPVHESDLENIWHGLTLLREDDPSVWRAFEYMLARMK